MGVVVLAASCQHHARATPHEWTASIEGAPVQIEEQKNGYLVRNISALAILNVQLGCLTTLARPTIVARFDPVESTLNPGESFGATAFHDDIPGKRECKEKNALLAPISAKFADGKEWRAEF